MGEKVRCPHCGAPALEDAAFCVQCGGRMLPARAPAIMTSTARFDLSSLAPTVPEAPTKEPPTVPSGLSAPLSTNTLVGHDTPVAPVASIVPAMTPQPAAPPPAPTRPNASPQPLAPTSVSRIAQPPPPPRRSPGVSGPSAASNAPRPPIVPTPPRNATARLDSVPPIASDSALPKPEPTPPKPEPTPPKPEPAPPKPEPARSSDTAAIDEIDRSFDSILSSPPNGAENELTPEELTEAQRLFREIAANYLAPVRSLMLELSLGEPSREWLAMCRPALASMRRAAGDMLLVDLATALGNLGQVMEQAERSNTSVLDARTRESLRQAYEPLVLLLPEAFAVASERDRREPIIVLSLLRQVPDVRKVALDRLYGAGLVTLEMFYKAKPGDLSEAAGISREVAERVVARFQRYRRELGATSPSTPPAAKTPRELVTLENLTRKLDEQTTSFEAARQTYGHPEDARRLRQERGGTVLEINLVLARLGEVDLVQKLERLAFRSKAEELRRFLALRKTT